MIRAVPIAAAALLAGVLVAGVRPPAYAQERMGADVECKRIGTTMQYDCLLKLKGALSGRPVEGAAVVVGADMPAHPMAHNVKPVKADPAGTPGAYKFRIALEMHGEWALKIRLAKPRQDLIVHKMMFKPE